MNPVDENVNPDVLDTVENLIRDYLFRRRETVIQAMLELHPKMVIGLMLEGIVGIKDIPAYHRYCEENNLQKQTQFIGIWRDEWRYFLHGFGCDLTHQTTNEHFDWDLGEADVFFLTEFFTHLTWKARHNSDTNITKYFALYGQIKQEDLKEIFFAMEKKNRLEYINSDVDLEISVCGDWQLKNIIFNHPEIWG